MTAYFTNYYKAREYAKAHNLIENVYGDWDKEVSYCGWNKTGNINDKCEVEVYYRFEGSKPERDESEWLDDWVRTNIGVEIINH